MKTVILINDHNGAIATLRHTLQERYDCAVKAYSGNANDPSGNGNSHGMLFHLMDDGILSDLTSSSPERRPAGIILDYQIRHGDAAQFLHRATSGSTLWNGWSQLDQTDLDMILASLPAQHAANGGGMRLWEAFCAFIVQQGYDLQEVFSVVPKILATTVVAGPLKDQPGVSQFMRNYGFDAKDGTDPIDMAATFANSFGLRSIQ